MHEDSKYARQDAPMAGGRDEVKHDVHSVVPEARVALDPRLLGELVIILSLEVAGDFTETVETSLATIDRHTQSLSAGNCSRGFVINLVSKAGGVDDRQRDAGAVLVQVELCRGSVSAFIACSGNLAYTHRQ